MRTVTIYLLVDPFTMETRYIGRTRSPLKKRLCEHISKAKNHRNTGKKLTYKENWILKLLKNNSKPLIRKFCSLDCTWAESHFIEKYLINEYGSKRNLTNLDDWGVGEESKVISEEIKLRISNTLKEGYKTGRILSLSKTEVYCYNLKGEFIKKFESVKDCSEELNLNKSSIARVLSNTYKQASGYRFYYEEQQNLKAMTVPKKTRTNIKVITKKGEELKFISVRACAAYFNIDLVSSRVVSNALYNTGLISHVYVNNELMAKPLGRHHKGWIEIEGNKIEFDNFRELHTVLGITKSKCYYRFIMAYCKDNNIKIEIKNLPT